MHTEIRALIPVLAGFAASAAMLALAACGGGGGALRHAAGQRPMKPQAPDPRPALFPPAKPPFDARQAARAVRDRRRHWMTIIG